MIEDPVTIHVMWSDIPGYTDIVVPAASLPWRPFYRAEGAFEDGSHILLHETRTTWYE